MTKAELWHSRRPDLAQAYDDELILSSVKPASRKRIAQARKRRFSRGGRKAKGGGKRS